jgi:hypothetical protein
MNCVIQVVGRDRWPHLPYRHYANVLNLDPKKQKKSESQKRPMTHLGVEFVKTSLLICLWPNEPKK